MTTLLNARNTLLAVAAVTAMTLPLIASASSSNISVSFNKTELESKQGQIRIYQEMKNASHEICGSSDVQLTGFLQKTVGDEDCYEGTLTAAVQRLDNSAITALHSE